MLRFLGILTFFIVTQSGYAQVQKSIKYNSSPPALEYAKPWEYGPNTCAYLSRPGIIDYKVYTYCRPWKQDYCGDYTEFEYDCCSGFKRVAEFGNKCVENERSWEFIPEHLNNTGFPLISQYLTNKGNFKEISDKNTKDTFTVFVPYKDMNIQVVEKRHEASVGSENYLNQFDLVDGKTERTPITKPDVTTNPALGVIVRERVYASSFQNGLTLETLSKTNPLKITKYSNGVVCVECREIVEPDHEAKNGIIHFLSDAIDVKQQKSLLETLQDKPNLSSFLASLPTNVKEALSSNCSKWFTVFAPINSVWDKVKKDYPANLLQRIAANHVVSGMYCKAALTKMMKIGPTESGEYLNVACTINGSREISSYCGSNDFKTVIAKGIIEIMATNGVIYTINDKPLIPILAFDLKNNLSNSSCIDGAAGDWMQALKECDLKMKSGKKYAVLIPTEKAMKWWAGYSKFRKYLTKFKKDADFRCRLIRYHIMEMDSDKSGKLGSLLLQQTGFRTNNVDELYEVDYFLKRTYGSELYFQYSPVDKLQSLSFKDGSIYKINRVNMIPEKNITTILKERPDLQNSHNTVQSTKAEEIVFTKNKPLNLFLAIKNGTWKESLDKLTDESVLKWLKLHWVNLQLWNDDIGYFDIESRHRFMSGVGLELIFDRRSDGSIHIGWDELPQKEWAEVVETNLFGTDGMVWIIDRALPCPTKYCPKVEKEKKKEKEIWTVLVFSCWDTFFSDNKTTQAVLMKNIEKWVSLQINKNECYGFKQIPKSEIKEHS